MKKILMIVGILGLAILTLGVVGYAYAQDQNPEYPNSSEWMGGLGRGRGRGTMMGGYGTMAFDGEYGPMHESMIAVLAEKTGLSIEEITARHDAGETMWDIALAAGLTETEIQEMMFSAHDNALQDAVANGWITEEHVEWMNEHMNQMWEGDYTYGGHCGGRGRFYDGTNWQGGQN